MEENLITEKIIGCAIEVHKQLGPGLLESAYEECLYYELINIQTLKIPFLNDKLIKFHFQKRTGKETTNCIVMKFVYSFCL